MRSLTSFYRFKKDCFPVLKFLVIALDDMYVYVCMYVCIYIYIYIFFFLYMC